VKLPGEEGDDDSINHDGGDQGDEGEVREEGENSLENETPGTLTFREPDKIERNPSPGRSRRSGILFKKKQYQPVTPSPLVLYSTTTSEDEQGATTGNYPLKLRLRIESPNTMKSPNKNNENSKKVIEYHRTRSHDSGIKTRNSESHNTTTTTNGNCPSTIVGRRRLSSHNRRDTTTTPTTRSRDHTMSAPTINGVCGTARLCDDNNTVVDGDDDCFSDNDLDTSDIQSSSPRKRTYTGSSANSDTEGGQPNSISQRRRSHKRGRQKRPKLSFLQEFADLEGINDIKYGVYMVHEKESDLLDPKIEPKVLDFLSLIWAKCKGYPSYPALVSAFFLFLVYNVFFYLFKSP